MSSQRKRNFGPLIHTLSESDVSDSDSNVFTVDLAFAHQVLSNELILKQIIESDNLRIMDLKNCRLVCKKSWENLATQRLQMKNWDERRFLSFSTPDEIRRYCKTYTAKGQVSRLYSILYSCIRIHTLPSLGQVSKKLCRTFPYKIKSLDLWLGPSASASASPLQELDSILASQSASLTELKIIYRGPPNGTKWPLKKKRKYNSMKDYSLSQLKYLCLATQDFHLSSDSRLQLGILNLICSKIPVGNRNSNSVKICLMSCRKRMEDQIAVLHHHQLINSFKIYEVQFINEGDCGKLGSSGVQLEFLVLHPCSLDLTQEICDFLCSQANSLKMLSWADDKFEFPHNMEKLKKLKLKYSNWPPSAEREENSLAHAQNNPILYDKCFPNLELLELSTQKVEQRLPHFHSMFLAPQFPCDHLQVLRLRNSRINAQTINLVSEIFPRLKTLDVGKYNRGNFDPEGAERLFYSALWSGNYAETLEEFGIELNMNQLVQSELGLESLFSGLRLSTDQIQQLDYSSEENVQIITDMMTNPSILEFKNLRKLEIFADGHVRIPGRSFTDFSAFVLFGQLKKLEYLYVDGIIQTFSKPALKYPKTQNEKLETMLMGDDMSFTSIQRIEQEFKTDWSLTDTDQRTSFNILK